MSSRRLLFLLLGGLTLLRLVLIGNVELSPDEAYYTMWSQHPDISYYSKGPGIAATIWLSTHLFGTNAFGVRIFSPLLALGTSVLMYRLARRLYGEGVAFWTVLTFSLLPIFQVGALLMTIDPLSMFFWMAAMSAFWRALESGPGLNRWWPATGALIGLGFLCKWTNAMELLSVLLLLAVTRRHRRELWHGGFWAMLGVFALFTAPPILWNAQHDWITLAHLAARGNLNKSLPFSPAEFGKFLAGQMGVYSPIVFLGGLYALWEGGRLSRNHFKPRFLLAFAIPILALYSALAWRDAGEPNWTAPAMLSLGLLTVALACELAAQSRAIRRWAVAGLVLSGVMGLLMLDPDGVRALGIPVPYELDSAVRFFAGKNATELDPSVRLRGWVTSAELVENFRSEFEGHAGHPVFLIANKYQTAATLAFYFKDKRPAAPGHPPVYIPESQAMENQFSFWPRYDEMEEMTDIAQSELADCPPEKRQELSEALAAIPHDAKGRDSREADARRHLVQVLSRLRPDLPLDESFVEEAGVSLFAGHDALYVTDRAEERPPSSIKGGFERVEMIACLDIKRRHLPLRQWRIFACYNYHGMSL